MSLDFLVQRAGGDPTAETSLHALRDLMRLPVRGVEAGTLWRFSVRPAGDSVHAELERAACRAGRYVNLNRDVYRWMQPEAKSVERGCLVDVWVLDGDGRDAVALSYFRAQVGSRVTDVRRGAFYRLHVEESEPSAARRLVEDLAVTRTRTHGLLANPNSQRVEILGLRAHAKEAS